VLEALLAAIESLSERPQWIGNGSDEISSIEDSGSRGRRFRPGVNIWAADDGLRADDDLRGAESLRCKLPLPA
jgi:hypothetical protein